MKEIKFRIWGVDFERYFYNVGFLNGEWFITFEDDEPDAFDCIGVPNEKEFIIEQFTGIYDKNGKEIYEGDIIKKNNKYVVYFDEGSFNCELFEKDSFMNGIKEPLNQLNIEYFEIIGNIHENGELLK